MSTADTHARVQGPILTVPFMVLCAVLLPAAFVLLQRFIYGLGAVTHLSDGFPWGIWIAIDLIIGTAFGCGGLVTALLVYIFNKGDYHPMVRAGLLTSLFGYSLGGAAVMIDLGRWWQGYNIMFPWLWNPNSVLLETALCIFCYIIVLSIEFSPAVFERFGLNLATKRIHRVMFIFTALGCLLPMMHQSSMGTVVVLLGYKLSPLWQSPLLTPNFLLTAYTMGFAVVAFESILSSMTLQRPYETPILSKLCSVMVWVQVAFMVLRYGDLIISGDLGYAFMGTAKAFWFWVEFIIGLMAVAFLMPAENRTNLAFIFLGAIAMLTNGFLYRLNAYLVGYDPGAGWTYFPSVGEIVVTLGIFATHFILYLLFVKTLPVLHGVHPAPRAAQAA